MNLIIAIPLFNTSIKVPNLFKPDFKGTFTFICHEAKSRLEVWNNVDIENAFTFYFHAAIVDWSKMENQLFMQCFANAPSLSSIYSLPQRSPAARSSK